MRTPWGSSDHQKKAADGIVFYGTPRHGGFHLSAERNAQVPDYMRCADGWYEEDCDWAIVAVVFPQYFKKIVEVAGRNMTEYEYAQECLRGWYPDAYEKFFNKQVKPGESYSRDKQLFRSAHANDYIVTAAWGDWHEKVPTGFVGCVAHIGGRDTNGHLPKEQKFFLVPAAEYKSRNQFGFVIDTNKHQEIDAIA